MLLPTSLILALAATTCYSFEVDFVPVIVDSGQSIMTFLSGDTMVLSCVVKAYPTPVAKIIKLSEDSNDTDEDDQWRLLDQELDFVSNVVGDSIIEVTLTQTVSPSDSGWYRCKTENLHGHAHSDTFVEVLQSFTSEGGFEYITTEAPLEDMGGVTMEWATEDEFKTESWATGSKEWATGSEEWATGSEEWATGSEEWATGSEEWATGSEEWATGSEEWATGSTEQLGSTKPLGSEKWVTEWFTKWVTGLSDELGVTDKGEWATEEWETDEWATDKWATDEPTDEWVTERWVAENEKRKTQRMKLPFDERHLGHEWSWFN